MNEGLLKTHNLTLENYRNGTWKSDNLGEDDLFDLLGPKITDLIREIKVKKTNTSQGDKYTDIQFEIKNKTSFEDHGIEIIRKDYYKNLKAYCISFRYEKCFISKNN